MTSRKRNLSNRTKNLSTLYPLLHFHFSINQLHLPLKREHFPSFCALDSAFGDHCARLETVFTYLLTYYSGDRELSPIGSK